MITASQHLVSNVTMDRTNRPTTRSLQIRSPNVWSSPCEVESRALVSVPQLEFMQCLTVLTLYFADLLRGLTSPDW